jgi:hypothetical protein
MMPATTAKVTIENSERQSAPSEKRQQFQRSREKQIGDQRDEAEANEHEDEDRLAHEDDEQSKRGDAGSSSVEVVRRPNSATAASHQRGSRTTSSV